MKTMFVTLYMQIIMCDAIVQVFSKINCSNCILAYTINFELN